MERTEEQKARHRKYLDKALAEAGLDHLPTSEELTALPVKAAEKIAVYAKDHPYLSDAVYERKQMVIEMRSRVAQPHLTIEARKQIMDEMVASTADGLPKLIAQAAAAEVMAEQGKRGRKPKGYEARSNKDRARDSRQRREWQLRHALQLLYRHANAEAQACMHRLYPLAAKFAGIKADDGAEIPQPAK